MAKKVIHSFGSGEYTPRLNGRTDFARYFNGCKILENNLVLASGGVEFRTGTIFVASTKFPSKKSILIDFLKDLIFLMVRPSDCPP